MLQSSHTSVEKEVDFLVIGHVTRDLLVNDPEDSVYTLGGTVSFAAVTALRLERQPTIVTRAAANVDLSVLPSATKCCVLPSPVTTTFANIYTETGRVQYCYTPAASISAADIPQKLRCPKIALLGPLVNEVESEVATIFAADTLVAAVPQGWMRSWDEAGRVYSSPWQNALEILPHLDVLVLSIEDVGGDLSQLTFFCQHVPLVILTEYRDGSTVYARQPDGSVSVTKVPPRPANEVDPTGAGDIFATAFLLRLQETGDPLHAARFANVTASFGVEAKGLEGIPTHQQVMAYLALQGELSEGER